jgi:hypothetical protein
VGAAEELPAAEADDAAVVPDVHVAGLGLVLGSVFMKKFFGRNLRTKLYI